jgi:hypothetical protein
VRRSALRLLPLADQAGGHVEIACENCPAGALPQTKGTDFFGLQSVHGQREAESVEFAQGALVYYARAAWRASAVSWTERKADASDNLPMLR